LVTFSAQPAPPRILQAGDIAAVLDWWREAGLDHDYSDAARDWLEPLAPPVSAEQQAAPAQPAAPPPPPALPRIGGDCAHWPQDLAAFAAWWLAEPSLDSGQSSGRVPPRGPAGAALMVLVDHPEASDAQRLLAGEQGRLVDAILAALGLAPDQAYVAAVLPRHMPMPDWTVLGAAGLGDLALHHVNLAAPQRLITFGPHVSSLLGHHPAKSAEPFQQFYHVGPSIPALAAPGLTTLMARPRGKAGLWQALLDWTGS
jgi:uracil-DNA glycosylase